jgi:hypothetical protein
MQLEATFPYRTYLNLGNREDRRNDVEYQFWQHGLEVIRQPGIKAAWLRDAWGYSTTAKRACALTKRLAIRRARIAGADAILLFEDDVVLHPEFRERVEAINLPDDWGIFYFGCQHLERPEIVCPGLVKVRSAFDNHAVAIRREHFLKVSKAMRGTGRGRPPQKTASDVELASLHATIPTYAAFPNLAWQAVSPSDVLGRTYSNYREDGSQRPNRETVRGLDWEMANPGKSWFDEQNKLALPSMVSGLQRRSRVEVAGEEEFGLPLVSCLMVTRNRPQLALRAVSSFLGQTYPNRELVIVDESETDWSPQLPESDKIRWHHIPSGKGPLGKMRNLSLQLAAGSVVMQWDDDDWSHPDRIMRQWESLGEQAFGFLKRLTLFWPAKQEAGITQCRAWECAFIARRDRISLIYPELERAEDSQLFDRLRKNCPHQLLDEPELYIRTVHGNNTWEEEHFDQFQNHAAYVPLDAGAFSDLMTLTNYTM